MRHEDYSNKQQPLPRPLYLRKAMKKNQYKGRSSRVPAFGPYMLILKNAWGLS
jgi:hypothetical protein